VTCSFKIENVQGNFSDAKSHLTIRQTVANVSQISSENVRFVSATIVVAKAARKVSQSGGSSWSVKTESSYNLVDFPAFRNDPTGLANQVKASISEMVSSGQFSYQLQSFAARNDLSNLEDAVTLEVSIIVTILDLSTISEIGTVLSEGEIVAIALCGALVCLVVGGLLYYSMTATTIVSKPARVIPVHSVLSSSATPYESRYDPNPVIKRSIQKPRNTDIVVLFSNETEP
jgi:hypothetical protein